MSSQVSSSRRYREQGISFVYPLLSKINDEPEATRLYEIMSEQNRNAILAYEHLRSRGVTKQDARRVIPVCSAVEKYISINARSLTNFFRLRLAPDAEWEIRRLATMVLVIVKTLTPSLFEDIQMPEDF
jgi:thymidylate synthase (FAD)